MKLSDFDYDLPKNLIATSPSFPRDAAKMLVLEKKSGKLTDAVFKDLSDFLEAGDVLVVNDSKVIPARLRATSGSREFEVLLIKNVKDELWEAWLRPGRKAKTGDLFIFNEKLQATLVKRENEIFFLKFNLSGNEFFNELEKIGEMPIPPYILKERDASHTKEDIKDYQTVFARKEGSVAAPTAGLHFTDELFSDLKNKGVQIEKVTLHVGLGTFQPVNTENIEDFRIHSEYFEMSPEVAQRITAAKANGNRIVAVGTTVVRVLESAAVSIDSCGITSKNCMRYGLLPKSGETEIYIYPGYEFKIVDAMVTNFHLPKSSLLLLVSAFAGKENTISSYKYAIKNGYKFYSYGDGMLIY